VAKVHGSSKILTRRVDVMENDESIRHCSDLRLMHSTVIDARSVAQPSSLPMVNSSVNVHHHANAI